jgi:hypothetical protein
MGPGDGSADTSRFRGLILGQLPVWRPSSRTPSRQPAALANDAQYMHASSAKRNAGGFELSQHRHRIRRLARHPRHRIARTSGSSAAGYVIRLSAIVRSAVHVKCAAASEILFQCCAGIQPLRFSSHTTSVLILRFPTNLRASGDRPESTPRIRMLLLCSSVTCIEER